MRNSKQLMDYQVFETDLHVHSSASNDGEFSAEDLLKRCQKNGVKILSITDHNSVGAIEEAKAYSARYGVDLIPGIEIDVNYHGIDLHLLGYQINWNHPDFIHLEEEMEQRIMNSVPKMIRSMSKLGIAIELEEILEKSEGTTPSPELFAEILLSKRDAATKKILRPYLPGGSRSDMPYINFYLDYFAQGKPAYVKIEHMTLHEGIALVTRHGGIPILAHPGLNLQGKEERVIGLIKEGLQGLEVFNNYHTKEQVHYFAKTAREAKILMTCGSDFHGNTKPLIELGKFLFPPEYLPDLSQGLDRLKRHPQS
jgi:predicted metal-dependent phosphoesterase TrpH